LIEQIITLNGQEINCSYDQEADMLEIIFQSGGGLGVDLTPNIVLRYQRDSQQALSLIFTDVATLTCATPFGPPSFQLTTLKQFPAPMQQIILQLLQTAPVNHFLKLSGLWSTPNAPQPITYLETTLLTQAIHTPLTKEILPLQKVTL